MNSATQELNTVLDSLSKLAELENRISNLETDNKYSSLKDSESTGIKNQFNKKDDLEFKKKKITGGFTNPGGIYELRNKG